MKLLFTSNGLTSPALQETFRSLVKETSANYRTAVFAVLDSKSAKAYVKKDVRALQEAGVPAEEIQVIDLSANPFVAPHPDTTVAYICGGNTFKILQLLRQTETDVWLWNHAQKNRPYVGVSAGAIIAGPDVLPATVGPFGDKNEVGLEDFSSLSLAQFGIFPHYQADQDPLLTEFRTRSGYEVVEVPNGTGVVSTDGTTWSRVE